MVSVTRILNDMFRVSSPGGEGGELGGAGGGVGGGRGGEVKG